MSALPFKPLGDRVVIKADREDRAPQATDAGVYLAKTLAAAVDGYDEEDSWFVGTVVGVGPLVNHFELRPYVLRRLRELMNDPEWRTHRVKHQLESLHDEVAMLPAECPDVLKLGDRVTFSWASGQQITVDGEKYLMMSTKDVLAVLKADELETM